MRTSPAIPSTDCRWLSGSSKSWRNNGRTVLAAPAVTSSEPGSAALRRRQVWEWLEVEHLGFGHPPTDTEEVLGAHDPYEDREVDHERADAHERDALQQLADLDRQEG